MICPCCSLFSVLHRKKCLQTYEENYYEEIWNYHLRYLSQVEFFSGVLCMAVWRYVDTLKTSAMPQIVSKNLYIFNLYVHLHNMQVEQSYVTWNTCAHQAFEKWYSQANTICLQISLLKRLQLNSLRLSFAAFQSCTNDCLSRRLPPLSILRVQYSNVVYPLLYVWSWPRSLLLRCCYVWDEVVVSVMHVCTTCSP